MHSTLLSDAHLKALDDPNQVALVDFVETWQTDAWVLVGDILDVWWSWESTVYVDYIPLLAALHRATSRGTQVIWVPGNHDFAPGPAVQALGVRVCDRWVDDSGTVLAVHGDGMDQRRRQRLLNRVLRGRIARAAMHLAGPDVGYRIAHRISDTSRTHGTAPFDLLERQARWADQFFETEDVSTVCVGHTHAPGLLRRERGALVNLGDWVEHRSFASVTNGRVELQRWTSDGAVPLSGEPARRI